MMNERAQGEASSDRERGSGCLWALRQLAGMFVVFVAVMIVVGLLMRGPLNDGKATCMFLGDSLAIGSTVYVDGQVLGVMAPDGLPIEARLERRVPRGKRRLVVVSNARDSLVGEFVSKAEATVWIEFADSSIRYW